MLVIAFVLTGDTTVLEEQFSKAWNLGGDERVAAGLDDLCIHGANQRLGNRPSLNQDLIVRLDAGGVLDQDLS
jgi:hypothetical protein